MSLQTGQIIDGKYRIIRELGSGSMGAVYEGENIRIKRRVAIKVLLPAVAERGDVVQRFEREAQAAGRIGSDHIVEVLDLGSLADGGFYMVMEFLEGETLGARIKRSGRLDGRAIAPLAQQLLMGLEMAHEANVIHRDLKPENVFLCREHAGQKDFVKILDFGVSKFNPLNDEEGMSMTRTGTVVGTPFYMAPEQAKGSRDIDHRSDLYSVGIILYEAVTGQVPFHAGTFNELIFKIVLETPPPPEQYAPDLDPGFGRILRKAMAREPGERYQHAAEFRDALYIWLHTGRDKKQPDAVRPPPIGSDVDWDLEKQTMLMNPDDSGNMSTRVFDEGLGGTAVLAPDNATTRVVDADEDNFARTLTKPSSPPASKRALPPPKKNRKLPQSPAPTAVQLALASGAAAAHGQRNPAQGAPTQALKAPPAPQPTGGGLGIGMPTPINRRPPSVSDWPTGVPRRRSPLVPIIVGSVIALAAGGAAAAFFASSWSGPHSSEVAEAEDESQASSDDDDATPDPEPEEIAHDTTGSEAPAGATQKATTEPEPPAPEPASAPRPPAPPPRAAPAPRPPPPRPRVVPPPQPSPAPEPPPPTPKPKPGRKVETTL